MQGKQLLAVNAYDKALSCATPNTIEYARIVNAKKSAIEKHNTRVDYISLLPVELVHAIFEDLPQVTKSACLAVSAAWRKRLIECAAAWSVLTTDDDAGSNHITSALAHIAHHVESLVINTSNSLICYRYLDNIQSGLFTRLRTLRMTDATTQLISSQSMTTIMSIAFYHIGSTVTELDLDLLGLEGSSVPITTLADVLSIFSKLTKLVFKAKGPLQRAGGNVTMLQGKQHTALVDLELRLDDITQSMIQPFLIHCPQIRRLIMLGCAPCVLRPVRKHLMCLKIFAYNYQHHVAALDSRLRQPNHPGLNKLYTSNFASVPARSILPHIRKCMKTAEMLYLHLDGTRDVAILSAHYAGLRFGKLKSLTLRETSGLQPIFLRAIQNSRYLTHLCMSDVVDYNGLVDTMIRLPALAHFQLQAHMPVDVTILNRLFEHYATLCTSPNGCPLYTIDLRMCFNVTDSILDSLANITSLKSITLGDVRGITADGLGRFYKTLRRSNKVTNIRLMKLDVVGDQTLVSLGKISSLTSIHLENLLMVTDRGITDMINANKDRLSSLTIKNCLHVQYQSVRYARRKVKTVVFERAQVKQPVILV
ncbi:hypothetical protein BDB00DRAFT_847425 [Zychaea mexicana]|uniref:uncharacterized protein n=1 Tax=Zychaea mexicana TaxID=64656 RepID=UPI0022FF1ADF|nr:uncharacterized protein BDB00DRAFT_847425 [Zychaea mexicana]KAI9488580.1 hypothetical protein BDB00DRAFT_847425 [Zychaea mexicana]